MERGLPMVLVQLLSAPLIGWLIRALTCPLHRNHLRTATSTQLFYINEDAVNEADKQYDANAPECLPSLPGTLTVHQLYVCLLVPFDSINATDMIGQFCVV